MEKSSNTKGNLLVGSFLIILGLLFIIDNYDLLDYEISGLIFRWESFLIFIGIVLIVSKSNEKTGIVIATIGIFFLGMDLYDFKFKGFLYDYWPIIVILIGIYFIYKKSADKKEVEEETDSGKEFANENADQILNRTFIFTEESIHLNSPKFSLSDSFFLFSALKLFFRNDQTNKSILINNTLILSSNILYFPSDWRVIDSSVNILAEVKDQRKKPDKFSEAPVTIVLKGANILGSIKIKEL